MNTWNVKKSVTDTWYTVHKHFQQISYTFLVRFSGQFTNAVIALNLKNWYCQRDMEKGIWLLKIHLISYLMKHTGHKNSQKFLHIPFPLLGDWFKINAKVINRKTPEVDMVEGEGTELYNIVYVLRWRAKNVWGVLQISVRFKDDQLMLNLVGCFLFNSAEDRELQSAYLAIHERRQFIFDHKR